MEGHCIVREMGSQDVDVFGFFFFFFLHTCWRQHMAVTVRKMVNSNPVIDQNNIMHTQDSQTITKD